MQVRAGPESATISPSETMMRFIWLLHPLLARAPRERALVAGKRPILRASRRERPAQADAQPVLDRVTVSLRDGVNQRAEQIHLFRQRVRATASEVQKIDAI